MDQESKRAKRLQSKKRKASALLAIAELNDADRDAKKKKKNTGENDTISLKKEVNTNELVTSTCRVSDKPLLQGEDYEQLKKKLRERKKALSCNPIFRLKSVGEEAGLDREKRVPLFMSDIQHLLTYSMVGDRAPYWPHRWTTLTKWNKLSNVVCLVVEGIGVDDYKAHKDSTLSWLPANIPSLLEVVSPASYSYTMQEELALMPLTVRHKKRLIEEFGSLENSLEQGEAFKAFRSIFPVNVPSKDSKDSEDSKDKTDLNTNNTATSKGLKLRLLLSASQMVTENYPLPLTGVLADRYQHFKLTSTAYTEVTEASPIYSVDCEMCLTDEGNELTRICVVDSSLAVVYHTLVKPRNTIRNYLTKYSGITPDMLEDVTTTLADVQEAIQKLLPSDAILVGQSLNCDLVAMQMLHPYVIDTSVIFNISGDRRRKSKLSLLAHLFLNMRIQTQGKHGHSPIEDAQTAMKLVNLKLEKGLAFGDAVLGGAVPVMDDSGVYSVPEETYKKQKKSGDAKYENLMTSLTKTLAEHEKTVALVTDLLSNRGYEEFSAFKKELKFTQTLDSSKEAIKAATTAALEHNLTICHVDLSNEEDASRIVKALNFTQKMFNFTSINGMLILLLAGTQSQNSVAGVVIKKPSLEHL